jgi:hypothetical protein
MSIRRKTIEVPQLGIATVDNNVIGFSNQHLASVMETVPESHEILKDSVTVSHGFQVPRKARKQEIYMHTVDDKGTTHTHLMELFGTGLKPFNDLIKTDNDLKSLHHHFLHSIDTEHYHAHAHKNVRSREINMNNYKELPVHVKENVDKQMELIDTAIRKATESDYQTFKKVVIDNFELFKASNFNIGTYHSTHTNYPDMFKTAKHNPLFSKILRYYLTASQAIEEVEGEILYST